MGAAFTMTTISFPESIQFDFALQFLQRAAALLPDIKWSSEHLEIQVASPVVARLLQRIRDRRPVVFPYIRRTSHFWLVMGATKRELDITLTQVGRFVVPTYAEFASESRLPQLRPFKANGNKIEQLGCVLYPAGYYSWRSPPQFFEAILKRLDLWMILEDTCPSLHSEQRPTYRSLHELFQMALAAARWKDAEQHLQEMQQLNLITSGNLAFLQVQLLAQQLHWTDIWNRSDFADLARMRMPRAVRAALLTAFHYNLLLPLEEQGQWTVALDVFQQNRSKLGLLLTGRFDLTQAPVIQVFAYLAAEEKDRESLAQLSRLSSAKEVQICIAQLQLLEKQAAVSVALSSSTMSLSSLQQARLALADLDYDRAIIFARRVAEPIERAIVLMQIAFHTSDTPLAEEALLTYWELPQEEQSRLEQQFTFLRPYQAYLQELTATADSSSLKSRAQNWLEWLHLVEKDPSNPELLASLDRLSITTDERFWDSEKIKLLCEKLLNFITDTQLASYRYIKTTLQRLADFFLQEANFPREDEVYADLYETLYMGLLENGEVNQRIGFALLRLAETILRRSPSERERICKNFIDWNKTPIPVLEDWALEAFELLSEYGLTPGLLAQWYREWVSYSLNVPGSRDRTHLEAWLLWGHWIQPGADLLLKLQESLAPAAQRAIDDPIASLSSGYRITIFSLRVSSSQRTKQLLLARNAMLDVRFCAEKDLNAEAKALAQNSDLVVIVTTCIAHALTYGIGPYLKKEPVYPQASGSTSILRAIEEYLADKKHRGI
jgi:hypothetical protein